jgi:hypothetical protein
MMRVCVEVCEGSARSLGGCVGYSQPLMYTICEKILESSCETWFLSMPCSLRYLRSSTLAPSMTAQPRSATANVRSEGDTYTP